MDAGLVLEPTVLGVHVGIVQLEGVTRRTVLTGRLPRCVRHPFPPACGASIPSPGGIPR